MSMVPRLRVPRQGQWSPLCGSVGRPTDQVLVRGPSVALGLVGKEKAILLYSKDPKTSEGDGGPWEWGYLQRAVRWSELAWSQVEEKRVEVI